MKSISKKSGQNLEFLSPSSSGGENRKKIMMVDDHPLTRAGLIQLMAKQHDLVVCCEAAGRNDALQYVEHNEPDLVIMDLSIPGGGGLELIKDLLTLYPKLPILVLSMYDENLYAARALRAGARGYVMKEAGAESVVQAIRTVLAGEVYLSPRMTAKIVESVSQRSSPPSASPLEVLSDRELEIFKCIGEGRSTKEIAGRLNLSPKTVDVHRANIRAKLDLEDANTLFRYAVCWVESPQWQGPG